MNHKIKKYLVFTFLFTSASYYTFAADFEFPENSWIYYSQDRSFNLSGLKLDISKMLRGGIAYGANGTTLLASGMRSIGSNNHVYNAPFCLYRRNTFSIKDDYQLWSDNIDDLKPADNIGEFEKSIRFLNIPLDIDGHASLASIEFKEGIATNIIFFDSLKDQDINYSKRYNEELIKAIMKFTSNNSASLLSHRVMHALYQGGEKSNGCGYYALFTAMLIKHNSDLINEPNLPLYGEDNDHLIRASVALVSFMHGDIWKSKNCQFDHTKAKTKVHHMLEIPESAIAESIWPRWYQIIGNENNMELWIKSNDLTRAKWSELIRLSSLYQAALKLPPCGYKTRFSIGNTIMDLASVIIKQEIVAKFSSQRLHSWCDWLKQQNYQYNPRIFTKTN